MEQKLLFELKWMSMLEQIIPCTGEEKNLTAAQSEERGSNAGSHRTAELQCRGRISEHGMQAPLRNLKIEDARGKFETSHHAWRPQARISINVQACDLTSSSRFFGSLNVGRIRVVDHDVQDEHRYS